MILKSTKKQLAVKDTTCNLQITYLMLYQLSHNGSSPIHFIGYFCAWNPGTVNQCYSSHVWNALFASWHCVAHDLLRAGTWPINPHALAKTSCVQRRISRGIKSSHSEGTQHFWMPPGSHWTHAALSVQTRQHALAYSTVFAAQLLPLMQTHCNAPLKSTC